MIEIICSGDDENKSEGIKSTKSTVIRRPKNIKQIGDVSSDRKIYIEDYAFTYINSIAYGSPDEEQAGVLLGECQKSDDEKCLFIKGVIKARALDENDRPGIYFDENIWNGIYSDIEKYFPNLQVVGWFAAMPNITAERMQYLRRVHLDNFAGNMKTMYLINTVEKEEYFYLFENGDLKRQKGYVCFYERNYEMQEYMLEKRGNKTTEAPTQDKVMKSIRTIIQEKEELKQQKRNASFIYGLSTFMVVVVLVIGINLMNSYEKMKNIDQTMNGIINQIANMGDNNRQPAVPANANVETTAADVVPVTKLDGNVYPTQEPTTTAAEQKETTAAPQTEAVAPTYQTYVVKSGDTIMSICKSYYGNASKYSEVIALNDLTDANKLYVGQEIKLP
jgi:LysM repeat protein